MWIIEIKQNTNGSHNDHRADHITSVPDGWAHLPDDMACENFPFGDITVEEIDGVMTVTGWTPGEIPSPDPIPEPEPELSVWEELDKAYQEGVNDV